MVAMIEPFLRFLEKLVGGESTAPSCRPAPPESQPGETSAASFPENTIDTHQPLLLSLLRSVETPPLGKTSKRPSRFIGKMLLRMGVGGVVSVKEKGNI